MIKSWIRNYFGFSRRETNGTIILFFLILLFLLLPLCWDTFIFRSQEVNGHDKMMLDSLIALIREKEPAPETEIVPIEIELTNFNPNSINKSELIRLGLQETLAQRIINYRQSGGKFRIKSDILKIYGFSESDYQRLERHIELPKELPSAINYKSDIDKIPDHPRTPPKVNIFDINNADSSDLVNIKGIGPTLAARIIKFRQALGGFTNKAQFRDVYGLSTEVVETLQESAYIEEGYVPAQININFANRTELVKHAYIDQGLSWKIIEFRDNNGPFKSFESLKETGIIDDSVLFKLLPYITF